MHWGSTRLHGVTRISQKTMFFFLQCFPTNALYEFQFPRMRSTCPSFSFSCLTKNTDFGAPYCGDFFPFLLHPSFRPNLATYVIIGCIIPSGKWLLSERLGSLGQCMYQPDLTNQWAVREVRICASPTDTGVGMTSVEIHNALAWIPRLIYRLDYRICDRGIGVPFHSRERDYYLLHVVQTVSGVHPAPCPTGTGNYNRRRGRDETANHSPLPSAIHFHDVSLDYK
jgi:hypothetical protein